MVKYNTSAQTTIGDSVGLVGIGVHSGKRVAMTLHPADPNTGIVFLRTELPGRDVEIKADWKAVSATDLCTVVGDPAKASVATIEHLMAALRGLSIAGRCGLRNQPRQSVPEVRPWISATAS